MQNNNQGNVPINFEVKLPAEKKDEFGYTPSQNKEIEKILTRPSPPKDTWKNFVKANEDADKRIARKDADKKHLKEMILFGLENSSEPVIKNPVMRKALEAKPKKSVNYLSDNYSFEENFKKKSKNIKDYKPKPSSVVRVASTMDDDKKYFDKLKEKGTIPLNLDFDKWLDEKEEFDLSPELDTKKKLRDDMILSNALQKIDITMSGIMSTLNLEGGGPVKNRPREPKIKKLNLADYFKVGMRIADLTPSERQLVSELLKKTLSRKSDN